MSQPPNQPPPGGFGAPQDPRQPARPQQPDGPPPPQPGYGYPQTPPTPQTPPPAGPYNPPQQPGPYHQPTQQGQAGPYGQPQPGPYNQPTQPAQPGPYAAQPQYGYPQQPPTQPQFPAGPGAGTPPGGGGNKRNKLVLVVAAAVAALLVAGGVTYAVVGGDDDNGGGKKHQAEKKNPEPTASAPVNPGNGSGDGHEGKEDLNAGRKPGEAKVLWYKEAPKVPGSGGDAPGMWIDGDIVVKAAYKQLLAYNVKTGKIAWDAITFPEKICAATQSATDDKKIVVAYKEGSQSGAECNQLQVVDLKTGDKGWGKPVKNQGLFDSSLSSQLALVGDVLMVGREQSGTALRMSDGKQLYVAKKKDEGSCFPNGFAGGEKLLMALSCGASTPTEHDELEQLDPKTGKALWTKKFAKGWRVQKLYSVSPTIVYLKNEDKDRSTITVLKSNSDKTRSEVAVKDKFAAECGYSFLDGALNGCLGATADDTYLYLPTEAKSGANDIVAISLATGKEAWRVKSPLDEAMIPMRTENGALIAYVKPSYDAGGRVVSIKISGSHKPETLLRHPQGTSKIESGFYSKDIDYVDGRFYISTTNIMSTPGQAKLMLAYGK